MKFADDIRDAVLLHSGESKCYIQGLPSKEKGRFVTVASSSSGCLIMRNFLAVAGKAVLFSLVLLTLVFPSFAQVLSLIHI